MKRRTLLKTITAGTAGIVLTPITRMAGSPGTIETTLKDSGSQREYWIDLLVKICSPILEVISKDRFAKDMPMIVSPDFDSRNPKIGYMEAFYRILPGLAPWLALPEDTTTEGRLREKLLNQALKGIDHSTNPKSADYFLWDTKDTKQPLVEAAFLSQAFLRAPNQIWSPLSKKTKYRVVSELKRLRAVEPNESNWLLFASIVEAFLYSIGEEIDQKRIDYAVEKFDKDWYVGDGWYSDGDLFSFDHYNGYVIHCLLTETLKPLQKEDEKYRVMFQRAYKRMQRYGHHLERMISPGGYPLVVGRSSTYRTAAFQPLAALALDEKLPEDISPAQVREALTTVYQNVFVKESFDENGWLTLGFIGKNQQNIADSYTNTGSLYLTTHSFLPLGLPKEHNFWTAEKEEWTAQKIFNGKPFPRDYSVNY